MKKKLSKTSQYSTHTQFNGNNPRLLTTNSFITFSGCCYFFFHPLFFFVFFLPFFSLSLRCCCFVFHPTTNSFTFLCFGEKYKRKQISSTHCAWYDWWRYVLNVSVLLLLPRCCYCGCLFFFSSCSFNFIFITFFVVVVAVIVATVVVVSLVLHTMIHIRTHAHVV